ncbi:MAG TPA: hypothetical protein VJZ49_08580 [Syntrophales bacterium]|nr:hypothetical protein [Syntrophales bacterium]
MSKTSKSIIYGEFAAIKMLAGLNSYQMPVLTTAPALKQIKE